MFFKQKQHNSIRAIGTRIVDTELSELIEKQTLVLRKKHTHTTVQKLAVLKFDKLPSNSNISEFIGEMTMDFQGLIENINQRCNIKLQKARGNFSIENTNEKQQLLQQDIEQADNKVARLKAHYNSEGKQYKNEVSLWIRIKYLLILICFGEAVANYEIFTHVGGGFFSNIALSLLVGVGTYFYAHFAPEKVAQYAGGNLKKKRIYYLLFLLPMALLSLVIAQLRMQHLSFLHPELSFKSSPLIVVTINLFAYIVSYWLVERYKVSKEKLLAYKKYQEHAQELHEAEQEKATLKTQQEALVPQLRDELVDRFGVMLLGQDLEQEVYSHYQSVFNAFKIELYVATSGACAHLFSGDIETDLPKLTCYYQNIKNPTI